MWREGRSSLEARPGSCPIGPGVAHRYHRAGFTARREALPRQRIRGSVGTPRSGRRTVGGVGSRDVTSRRPTEHASPPRAPPRPASHPGPSTSCPFHDVRVPVAGLRRHGEEGSIGFWAIEWVDSELGAREPLRDVGKERARSAAGIEEHRAAGRGRHRSATRCGGKSFQGSSGTGLPVQRQRPRPSSKCVLGGLWVRRGVGVAPSPEAAPSPICRVLLSEPTSAVVGPSAG